MDSWFPREYGLYGESLHSIEKTQTEGFLFPGRKDGASTGSGAIVYGNLIRKSYKKTPVILGGNRGELKKTGTL